jgi:hypothetical protein
MGKVGIIVVAPLVGFIGVLVGQVFVRNRELRDMRRVAYTEWMKAAVGLTMWVGDVPSSGTITLPHLDRLHELNLRTTELSVVGSTPVLRAADEYRAIWTSEGFAAKLASVKGYHEIIGAADGLTLDARRKVQTEMRRDPFPWWMWREWGTTAAVGR